MPLHDFGNTSYVRTTETIHTYAPRLPRSGTSIDHSDMLGARRRPDRLCDNLTFEADENDAAKGPHRSENLFSRSISEWVQIPAHTDCAVEMDRVVHAAGDPRRLVGLGKRSRSRPRIKVFSRSPWIATCRRTAEIGIVPTRSRTQRIPTADSLIAWQQDDTSRLDSLIPDLMMLLFTYFNW